jgi:hypothetical protein
MPCGGGHLEFPIYLPVSMGTLLPKNFILINISHEVFLVCHMIVAILDFHLNGRMID